MEVFNMPAPVLANLAKVQTVLGKPRMERVRLTPREVELEVEWTYGRRFMTLHLGEDDKIPYELYSHADGLELRDYLTSTEWWRLERMFQWCLLGVGRVP